MIVHQNNYLRIRIYNYLCSKKGVHFIQPDGTINKKTTFSSSYYCYNLLDKQIVMGDFDYD